MEKTEIEKLATALDEHKAVLTEHAVSVSKHFDSTAPILQQLKNASLQNQKTSQLKEHLEVHKELIDQYKIHRDEHQKILDEFIAAQTKALNQVDNDKYHELIKHHQEVMAEHDKKIQEYDDAYRLEM